MSAKRMVLIALVLALVPLSVGFAAPRGGDGQAVRPACSESHTCASLLSANATHPVRSSCKAGGAAERRVIRLHLSLASINGGKCEKCIMVGQRTKPASPLEPDDNSDPSIAETPFSPAEYASPIPMGDGEWPTPFDFNLDKSLDMNTLPSTLVEVLLDDPKLSFMIAKKGGDNSRFAVLATKDAVASGLFDCRRQFTKDSNKKYVNKLRFHINSRLGDKMLRSGAINIGVLVHTGTKRGADEVVVPIYIDPHPQNGG